MNFFLSVIQLEQKVAAHQTGTNWTGNVTNLKAMMNQKHGNKPRHGVKPMLLETVLWQQSFILDYNVRKSAPQKTGISLMKENVIRFGLVNNIFKLYFNIVNILMVSCYELNFNEKPFQ